MQFLDILKHRHRSPSRISIHQASNISSALQPEYLNFNSITAPPLRSLLSCQASIIHFLQIVVLLVIVASFSILIHPILIHQLLFAFHYLHKHPFLLSFALSALPHFILIVPFPRTHGLSEPHLIAFLASLTRNQPPYTYSLSYFRFA